MIILQPTQTRYVEIHHLQWHAVWHLQFPESIGCRQGWVMDFPAIYPQWQRAEDGGYAYHWQSDAQYIAEQEGHQARNAAFGQEKKQFIAGVHLYAALTPAETAVYLHLELTNNSQQRLTGLVCEGGCFQAKSAAFTAEDEVSRTYISTADGMQALSTLTRTQLERCVYHTDLQAYELPPDNEGEWFWGRSQDRVVAPVMVGMVAVDGGKTAVIGYENALSGSANADEHHCMHSRPHFGDLQPGDTVIRKGMIAFDSDIESAAKRVREYVSIRENENNRR
ncbi:hypothetical protein [Candidatus Leptofilum sp.]|uniref:hypothetical protein n=1 Tax=Candidatus Leptofilum sp. TaxID=3241576 RepID=UPI003B58E226